jgi:electron transfer flavoprotein alpha subunit
MAGSLVLIEHDRQQVKRSSLHAITLARQLGGEYVLLVLGQDLDGIARSLVSYGASAVVVADDSALAEPLADRYAKVIEEAARKGDAKTIMGTSSTFSKDVLPRVAALLDAPMVTDVVEIKKIDGSICYRRPINAGSMFAVVKVEGDRRVLTARATAFEAPAADAAACPIERLDFDAASIIKSDRPARSWRPSCTSRLESRARFSTWLASRTRGSSSRLTKTPTHPSFR